jgi:hypothetical protein
MCSSIALIVIACSASGLCGEPKVDPETGLPPAAIYPGDTVRVTTGPAPLKVGDNTLATVETGTELRAIAVQGAWVKVTVEKDGLKNTGWINERHLKFVAAAIPEKAPVDPPAKAPDPPRKAPEGLQPKVPEPPLKPPTKQLGIWEGFRGIAWATNLKDIQGMELSERGRVLTIYKRANDDLFMGEARLTRIGYSFYKNRFDRVLIEWDGVDNLLALKQAVFAVFGEGHRPDRSKEEWYWGKGYPVGVEDVVMSLRYYPTLRTGTLFIGHRPLIEERKRDEAIPAKKAKKGF